MMKFISLLVLSICVLCSSAQEKAQGLAVEGRIMKTISIVPGTTQTSVATNELAPGIYVLQYINGNGMSTIKFIKQ